MGTGVRVVSQRRAVQDPHESYRRAQLCIRNLRMRLESERQSASERGLEFRVSASLAQRLDRAEERAAVAWASWQSVQS